MSTKAKMIERLLSSPADYTYFELKSLSMQLGCSISQKGRGSRCILIAPSGAKFAFHRPHNYSCFKEYAVKDMIAFFQREELI